MTQIFGEDGAVEPATVLNVETNTVSQIKTNPTGIPRYMLSNNFAALEPSQTNSL